jgi:hypothetical protein
MYYLARLRAHLRGHWWLWTGAGGLLLLVAVYVAAALAAVQGYSNRIASSSLAYDGQFQFNGQDFLSTLNSNLAFSGAFTGSPNLAADSKFLGAWAGHEYSGTAQLAAGSLYFNISGPVMPVIRYRQSAYLVTLKAGQWYSETVGESLYDNICAHNQSSTIASKLDLYRTIRTLRISPSPWVNFFSMHNGIRSTHLSGSLSGDELAKLYQAATSAQPPGCNSFNTLGLSADDLKHVSTHIDLFTNKAHDTIIVTLSDKTLGATARLALSTYKYNQPVQVTPPSNVVNLNSIFAHIPQDLLTVTAEN